MTDQEEKTIWLYGESSLNDPPSDRVAFESKADADDHARKQAEEYATDQQLDCERTEYDSWFGYTTKSRVFQVWPIQYHRHESVDLREELPDRCSDCGGYVDHWIEAITHESFLAGWECQHCDSSDEMTIADGYVIHGPK